MTPTLGIAFPEKRLLVASTQQPVTIRVSTWARYAAIGDGGWPDTISRDDLVHVCREALRLQDPAELRRAFILTMMWGGGTTNGRQPNNTSRAISAPDFGVVLEQSVQLLGRGDVGAAYNLHSRLERVGPAFHTKWLWALGAALGTRPSPLIQDRLVWMALADLGWDSVGAANSSSWAERYIAYLHACADWADAAGRTPVDIEYSLFCWGRTG